MAETKENDENIKIEMSVPVIGLMKGIWVMGIGAFAFIGTSFVFTYAFFDPSFDIIAKSLLGTLLAITAFGCMFGISRYFTEEQIKYTAINMRIK
jgi:hypothetical protein